MLGGTGALKIGQNPKFASQVLAERGIEIASYDDTVLMSYVADAGRSEPRPRSGGAAILSSTRPRLQRGDQGRQDQDHVDAVGDRPGTEDAAEKPTPAAAVANAQAAAAPRNTCCHVYESLERPPSVRFRLTWKRRGIFESTR